jgi:filamentous hemagglutinin family protein
LAVNRAACLVLLGSFVALLYPESSQAQSIRPATDGTGTVVNRRGDRQDITGGTRSRDGQNLFHSFERFGLSAGEIANFRSNPQIVNILGRITGGDPSVINGLLQVTGGSSNLFLLNPAGIVFGSDARLDVPASFTATTANGIGFGNRWFNALGPNDYAALVSNPDQFAFTMAQPGAIANFGELTVNPEQNLTLLGGTVINTGTLSAPGGSITVAAVPGQNLVRVSQAGSLLSLDLQPTRGAEGSGLSTDRPNSLPFTPVSLPALLTGGNLDGATDIAVNPDGSIRLLSSGQSVTATPGTAIASGTISTQLPTPHTDASHRVSPPYSTSEINILGDRVALLSANLNASGTQGGTVRIGGDYQGRGHVFNASRTFVSADSVIAADGRDAGNGGRIIVWADEATRFYGSLSARGGLNGGNGGFAEVSGLEFLDFSGRADLSGGTNGGQVGTLLLDPTNIEVIEGLDNPPDLLANDEFADPGIDNVITNGTINAAVANVVLQATNNITVSAPIAIAAAGVGLTAQANNDIAVNAGITTNGGALNLNAGNAIAVNGAIATNNGAVNFSASNIAVNAGITTNNGGLTLGATNDIAINAGITATNAAVNFNANDIAINGGITTSNGTLTFNANNDIVVNAGLTTSNAPLILRANNDGVGAGRLEINQALRSGGGAIALQGDATGTATSGIFSSATGTLDSGGGAITLNGSSDNQAGITLNGAINSRGGAVTITSTSTAIVPTAGGIIAAPVDSGGGNISITGINTNAPDQGLAIFSNLNAGAGNLTLSSDGLCLSACGGSIAGSGALLFQPVTANRAIALGGTTDSGADTLDLLAADLTIPDGFSGITIGRANGSGTITLTGNLRFTDPVTLQAPATTGSIDTAGFTISAPSIRAVAGDQIILNGAANSGGGSFTAESIRFDAGNAIIVNDTGITSSTFAVNNFTLNASNSITFNDSNDTATIFGARTLTLTAPTINLLDSISLAEGNLAINGDVNTPGGAVNLSTGSRAGTITFSRPLSADLTVSNSGVVRLEQGLTSGNIEFFDSPELQLSGRYLGNQALRNVRISLIGDTVFGGASSNSFSFDNTLLVNNHALTIQSNNIRIRDILGGAGSSVTLDGAVTAVGDVTITADEIDFTNRVAGTGDLTLQPATLNQAIALGGAADTNSNTLDLSQTDLNQLQNGFSSLTIGNASSSGLLRLAGNVTFRDPVTLRSPLESGAINTSGGDLFGIDNASIRLLANQSVTTGNITTDGQSISITSNRGAINTTTSILNTSTPNTSGTINLLAAGNITLGDLITGEDRVTEQAGDITIRSSRGNVVLGDIRTSGLFQAGNVSVETNDGNITLTGNQSIFALGYGTANGGSINFTSSGDIRLSEGSRLNAFAESGDGGLVTLLADGNINTGDGIDVSNRLDGGDGGQISITSSSAGINTTRGALNSSSSAGNGGAIILNARRSVNTADLLSNSSGLGAGGNLRLSSSRSSINTQTGTLNSSSAAGSGGAIALTAREEVETGSIVLGSTTPGIGGGAFSVSSRSGLIDLGSLTTNGVDLLLGSATNRLNFQLSGDVSTSGGSVRLFPSRGFSLNSRITTAGGGLLLDSPGALTLTAPIATEGGSIVLRGTDINAIAALNSSNTNGRGGAISLAASTGNISTNRLTSTGNTGGGTITLSSEQGSIATGPITSSATAGNSGAIAISAQGNITTADVLTSTVGPGNGGDISLTSRSGSINAAGGILDTRATSGNGGAIALNAQGNITATDILSSANSGAGGAIALTSRNGAIATNNLNSSGGRGGSISVIANTSITTGAINSSGSVGNGGNVNLDPIGDIVVDYIDARGGSNGRGGNVTIRTQRFFRALRTFLDRFNQSDIQASISTAGGLGGGDITIQHGGNSATPFRVGNISASGADNGTVGSITSGSSIVSASPPQSFQGVVTQGNIRILTQETCPPICIPQSDTTDPLPPPTTTPDPVVNTPPDVADPATPVDTLDSPFGGPTLPAELFQVRDLNQVRTLLLDIQSVAKVRSALVYVSFSPADVVEPLGFSEREAAATRQFEQYFNNSQSSISPDSTLPFTAQPTDQLELLIVTGSGDPIRRRVANITRADVQEAARRFRNLVTSPLANRNNNYLTDAQQLYSWMVQPVEADLQRQGIQNLSFIMDPGLRSLPIAALHDGQRFLVEKYSVSLLPSISLIDTSYINLRDLKVLAMGISQFPDRAPLPAVPLEIETITPGLWSGESFLNDKFTLGNFRWQRQQGRFGIVHLATHAEFRPGQPSNSFIQLWDQKVRLDQLRQLGLNDPPVELLVLSACRTALGDEQAELGFAGLALQAGVQSALASLWYVSDEGTLAFMTEFYRQLSSTPIKAEALRQTQIAMIHGDVRLESGELIGSRGEDIILPPELIERSNVNLSHPFFWSAFTLVGSPW